MIVHFTTRSGAEYAVDPVKKTWRRVAGPDLLYPWPQSGNYVEMSEIRVGWGVVWSIDNEIPGQVVENNSTPVIRIWETEN